MTEAVRAEAWILWRGAETGKVVRMQRMPDEPLAEPVPQGEAGA